MANGRSDAPKNQTPAPDPVGGFRIPAGVTVSKPDRWCPCGAHLALRYGVLVCPVCDLAELPDIEDEDQ